MSDALRLVDVWKRYAAHLAVRGLTLTAPSGCIYGILGPNGAGKSTTLRMVMNIIARDSGAIEVLGRAPDARGALRSVGYLPEERGLYRRMRVIDLLVFFGRLKGMSAAAARRDGAVWLERLGLADWRGARLETLSKGMQQKVQFITTVLHHPELLILDEPYAGLDPVNQEVLRETILRTRAEGGTVVLSTHNMNQAEALCDAVCIIAGGSKLLDGSVREVKRRHRGERYRLQLDAATSTPESAKAIEDGLQGMVARLERSAGDMCWDLDLNGRPARAVLETIAGLPVQLERFERLQPSLHEIFIQEVGVAARHAAKVADA